MKIKWDICEMLHAMNDFGFKKNGEYSRSHTYNAECYANHEGGICSRNGRCLIARNENWKQIKGRLVKALEEK